MRKRALTLALVALLAFTAVALAQGGYNLTWWTVDGGGGRSAGSGYILNGTIGQPDAGPKLQGGDYTLQGGFWPGGAMVTPEYEIFLPLVLRGS
ncbi:MAG TPA: hypothetical protein ENG33_07470 [Chloroflexi bacterium]|nr:hypothetical protein [Chloroflexota bacterium]